MRTGESAGTVRRPTPLRAIFRPGREKRRGRALARGIPAKEITVTRLRYHATCALAILAALLAAAATPASADHPWPMYHRNAQRGGQAPVDGPRFFEVKWIADLGSSAKVNYASPVVDQDGRTYIGTGDGKVHCIGPDGQPAGGSWPYDTGATAYEFDQTPSTPSAAIAEDGSVYILDVIGRLHRVTSSGGFVWRYDTPGNAADSHPLILPSGSVAIATYLFKSQFDADAFLRVVKPDMSLDWSADKTGLAHVLTSPALDALGNLYVTTFMFLWQYGPSGTPGFSYNNGRNHMYCAPALDPVTGNMMLTDFGGNVIAVNPAGLPPAYKTNVFANVSQSSLAVGSTGYAVGTAYGSNAAGVRTTDGSKLWMRRLSGLARSSPSLDAEEVAYFGVEGGRIYSIKRGGAWQFIVDIGTDASSTPAFNAGGDLLMGFDTACGARLLCLSSDPNAGLRTVGHARTLADSQQAEISPKPVVYKGSGFFYIQDWDGTAGIRVLSDAAIAVGDVVGVTGTVGTDAATGERRIAAQTVNKVADCVDQTVRTIRAGSIGGSAVTGGVGLVNTGTLIRTSGRVGSVAPADAGYVFTINDGSSDAGLTVYSSLAPGGSFLAVTGVVSLEQSTGGDIVPVLLTRAASDMVVAE